ncbi:hypothetical protein QZH41_009077, partial [Actinostola sp. cb2023]
GLAPVHLAALHGQVESLKVLIDKFKVDVNLPSDAGWTPLLLSINTASEKRALKCVKFLLDKGADHSRANYDGSTVMHQVAIKGYVKCLVVLIKAGAIIDGIDSNGNTPMDLTRVWGHRLCARILAKHQWFLDKEKELQQRLEEEKRDKESAQEIEKQTIQTRIKGQNEGQVAFKSWLTVKRIPDIPTMYGPLPREERKANDGARASKSCPNMNPSKTESTFVVKSKSEMGPSTLARKARVEVDEDKRLHLIPLDRVSASKRRQIQRTEQMKQNRLKGAKSLSPSPSR